jgi:hypothetical protein
MKKRYLLLVFLSALSLSACIINGFVKNESGEGVSNVTMTLSGPRTDTVTTGASGKYQFDDNHNWLPVGKYTITPSKIGLNFTPPSQTVTITTRDYNGEDTPWPVNNVDFVAREVKGEPNTESVIVFYNRTKAEVYSSNINGTNLKPLTNIYSSYGGMPYFPSPNGEYVASIINSGYSHRQIGEKILISSLKGGQKNILIELPGYYRVHEVSWSPDSKNIIYLAHFSPEDVTKVKLSLRTFSISENKQFIITERLDSDYSIRDFQWSPDNTRIYYYLGDTKNKTVKLIVSLSNGNKEFVVAGEGKENIETSPSTYAPTTWRSWSSDGKKIAFFVNNDNYTTDLFTASLDGSNKNKIGINVAITHWDMTWSNKGNFISFNSWDINEKKEVLRIIASDGSNEILIPQYTDYLWTPDNKLISYDKRAKELLVVNPGLGITTKIPVGLGHNGSLLDFKISPDGETICYNFQISEKDDSGFYPIGLFVVNIDGSNHYNISTTILDGSWSETNEYSGPSIWSPNSQYIVFAEYENANYLKKLFSFSISTKNKILLINNLFNNTIFPSNVGLGLLWKSKEDDIFVDR